MRTTQACLAIIAIAFAACSGLATRSNPDVDNTPAVTPDASPEVCVVPPPDTAPACTDVLVVADTAPRAETQNVPDAAPANTDSAAAETAAVRLDAGTPDTLATAVDTAPIEVQAIDTTPIGTGNTDAAPAKFDAQEPDTGTDTTVIIDPPLVKYDAAVKNDVIVVADTQPSPDLAPPATDTQPVVASSLTITLATSPPSVTAVKGVTVYGLGIDLAAGASSYVKVMQLALRAYIDLDGNGAFTASETDSLGTVHSVSDVVQAISIWDGDTQIGSAQAPDANGDVVFWALNWMVPVNTLKHLLVRVTLSANAPFGASPNFVMVELLGTGTNNATSKIVAADKDDNAVVATSASWTAGDSHLNWNVDGSGAGSSFAAGTGAPIVAVKVVASGSLVIKLDDSSPASMIMNANTTDNTATRIKVVSTYEAFKPTRLTVANLLPSSSRSITSVRLYDKDGTLFCSGALDNNSRLRCANDTGLFIVNSENIVTIKVNIDQEGAGELGAHSGDRVQMALYIDQAGGYADDIKAVGVSSGAALIDANVVDQGSSLFNAGLIKVYDDEPTMANDPVYVSGAVHTVYKTQPWVATVAVPTAMMSGENTLYRFSVTAATNADVSLKRFIITSYFADIGSVGNARLLINGSTYGNVSIVVPGGTWGVDLKASTITNPAGSIQIVIAADTEIVVSAGASKIFEFRAILTGAHAGSTVMSNINADPFDATIGPVSSHEFNYFLWSDNSADVHTVASADWIGGTLVRTFPTNVQYVGQ